MPNDVMTPAAVSRITLEAALDMGPERWDALALASPFPSAFMSWAWHRAWLHGAPEAARAAAFVLTDFRPDSDAAPSVILPLAGRTEALHHLKVPVIGWAASDVGTPDHLEIMAVDEAQDAALADAVAALPWNMLVLTSLVEGHARAAALASALEERGCRTVVERLWACAQIELPDTWDEYLAQLSGKRRYRIRKDERDLRNTHEVELIDYSGDRFDEGWAELVRLHTDRWEGGGCFDDPRLSAAYRHFAELLAGQDRLGLMGLLVDGELRAIEFWAEFGGTMFGIQSGRDPDWDRSSVGRVLRGLVIQRAIEVGLQWVDFSRGLDSYKGEWCPSHRWCYELRVFRPSWSGRLLGAWDSAVVGSRRIRSALGRLPPVQE